jgi:hypothetical protein
MRMTMSTPTWEEDARKACLQLVSTGDGRMDGIAPNDLTHANVMDGNIKYKTLRKNKLQLLCGNLLDHIKDLEVKKAKVKLRIEEELKEAKVKVEARGGVGVEGGRLLF